MKLRSFFLSSFYYGSQRSPNPFKAVNLTKDYYKILRVEHDACENTIKKSYLNLVKKLHPDLNPSGHEQFTQVQQAYNILCDKKMRSHYDRNSKLFSSTNSHQEYQNSPHSDFRNEEFYNRMRNDYDHTNHQDRQKEKSQHRDPQQTQEEAKQRKKFQDEIKLTRKILFTKNPIWERANAFMNYQQRQRRIEQKQKQLEILFPNGAKLATSLKKWML